MTTVEHQPPQTPHQEQIQANILSECAQRLQEAVHECGTFLLDVPGDNTARLHVAGGGDGLKIFHSAGSVRQFLWLTSVEFLPAGAVYSYTDAHTHATKEVHTVINEGVLTDPHALSFIELVDARTRSLCIVNDFKLWRLRS